MEKKASAYWGPIFLQALGRLGLRFYVPAALGSTHPERRGKQDLGDGG